MKQCVVDLEGATLQFLKTCGLMLTQPGVLSLQHVIIVAEIEVLGYVISHLQNTSGDIGGAG